MLGLEHQDSAKIDGRRTSASERPMEAIAMDSLIENPGPVLSPELASDACAPTAVHRKLGAAGMLGPSDVQVLDEILANRFSSPAGSLLVSEKQLDSDARVLLSGWAFRSRVFEDGRRQISRLFLPGDFIGLHSGILGVPEQTVAALTNVQLARFNVHHFVERLQESTGLWLAVLWSDSRDRLISEERIASIGRRSAYQRLAHIFLEMYMRLEFIGAASDDAFISPMTQDHLADLLGLTSIHVNRTLRQLRRDGLIAMQGRTVRLLSRGRLAAIADFDPRYLVHQDRRQAARQLPA
jgi:CRP-like cAMP-binding protein